MQGVILRFPQLGVCKGGQVLLILAVSGLSAIILMQLRVENSRFPETGP